METISFVQIVEVGSAVAAILVAVGTAIGVVYKAGNDKGKLEGAFSGFDRRFSGIERSLEKLAQRLDDVILHK